MGNDEKPFPCTSPGCTMRFANEDHLSFHKKRHISLTIDSNSGSKTPNFVADETPTPTRFIRNCEEVGLFQEIGLMQNINPFDEQFRRAAEVSTLTTPTPSSTDDALHTPHVFPVSMDTDITVDLPPPKPTNARKSSLMPLLSTSECLTIPSPLVTPLPMPTITITSPSECAPHIVAVCETPNTGSTPPESKYPMSVTNAGLKRDRTKRNSTVQSSPTKTSNYITNGVNILPRPVLPAPSAPAATDPLTTVLLRLPDGRLVQIPAIPVGSDPNPVTSVSNPRVTAPLTPINLEQQSRNPQETKIPGISEAKLKLKQALTKTKNSTLRSNQASAIVISEASETDTDQSASTISETRSNQPCPSKRRRGYNSASDQDAEDEEREKRRKFLERNRAAAYRSRQKRKRWVSSLEAKTAAMNAANKLLQNEVIALRSEVAQLKLQLLAHKNCPVTLAMCKQSSTEHGRPLGNDCLTVMPVTSNCASVSSVNASTSSSTTRQIIILNPTSQAPQTASNPSNPSTKSVCVGSSPFVVLPVSERNAVSDIPSITITPNTEIVQPSVIMSFKLSTNNSSS